MDAVPAPLAGIPNNIEFQPTRVEGICDFDGTELVRRADDSDHVVHERLKAYATNTSPAAEYYRAKGRYEKSRGIVRLMSSAER